MPDEVITSEEMAFLRGRKAFADGEPCPPDIWTDEQWCGKCNDEMLFRLGWMTARAVSIGAKIKSREYQEALRRWAEECGPLPEYPK